MSGDHRGFAIMTRVCPFAQQYTYPAALIQGRKLCRNDVLRLVWREGTCHPQNRGPKIYYPLPRPALPPRGTTSGLSADHRTGQQSEYLLKRTGITSSRTINVGTFVGFKAPPETGMTKDCLQHTHYTLTEQTETPQASSTRYFLRVVTVVTSVTIVPKSSRSDSVY